VALRPSDSIRLQRLAKRLLPSLADPKIKWIKAVLPSTNDIMGVACWTTPGVPVLAHFRRDAVDFFKWQDKMKWTNAELDEMWAGVSDEQWNGQQIEYDKIRREVMGDEPHWFLSPVITWPEYQGRGVGKKLMMWAIDQADSTDPPTPMYLESAPTARAVYMHLGFVPHGKVNMLRRGAAVVRGDNTDEAEKKKDAATGKLE
jgi:GNAT superfamily N-acetyltransferase